MEEIETIFSLVDSKMLNLRINIFDEKCCTKKEQTSSFRNTRFILDEVSKTYFESFKYAISMAEKGESADKIANRFKRILPTIETLSIDFEKKLS